MIDRWDAYNADRADDGVWVFYDDHEEAVKALEAENARLRAENAEIWDLKCGLLASTREAARLRADLAELRSDLQTTLTAERELRIELAGARKAIREFAKTGRAHSCTAIDAAMEGEE